MCIVCDEDDQSYHGGIDRTRQAREDEERNSDRARVDGREDARRDR